MRLSRLYAPGEVQLVQVQFAQAQTQVWQAQTPAALFDTLASWLADLIKKRQVQLHAWSLTPEAMLMLVSPPDAQALSAVVQAIGRRLAATLKSGGVFAGRYKSALVEPDRTLAAQVWIELAALREGYIADPVDWVWSSAGHHVGVATVGRAWSMPLSDLVGYWQCGNTPFDRQAAYREKLHIGLSPTEQHQIEAAVAGQWALGSSSYLTKVSKLATRRVSPGKRGRPPKSQSNQPKVIRP